MCFVLKFAGHFTYKDKELPVKSQGETFRNVTGKEYYISNDIFV